MSEPQEWTPGDELATEVMNRQPNAPLSDYLVAVICHEANRIYCASIGDWSQKPWLEAEQWQRVSAIKGVAFNRMHPDALASASHESWLEEKRAEGWSYGPEKDPAAKTHPCFLPYEMLALDQRRKDALFKAIVGAMDQEVTT